MTTFDPADTFSGNLPAIPDQDWDPPTLAMLRDDGQAAPDLRHEHYTEQVVAALHGDPRVLTLDPLTQEAIASISRVFEHIARGILSPATDPKVVTRRAAVLLMADPAGGTPMRCPHCGRIHQPLTGPVDWEVAGREDIACPPCWKAQPKHATKAAPVKAAAKTAAAGTRRKRPSPARSQARKAAGGTS